MNPFEDLIQGLGTIMGIPLRADNHQSCLITFLEDELAIQIDLDTNGDRILLGCQLGRIPPGIYRVRIFTEALRANGMAQQPQGILAFSEKNDTLILYQFLDLNMLKSETLHDFLNIFREHANLWKKALKSGDIPYIKAETPTPGSSMYGLKP